MGLSSLDGQTPLTKLATVYIDNENHLKSFFRTKKALRLSLDIEHRRWEINIFCSHGNAGLTFGLLQQGYICFPIHL